MITYLKINDKYVFFQSNNKNIILLILTYWRQVSVVRPSSDQPHNETRSICKQYLQYHPVFGVHEIKRRNLYLAKLWLKIIYTFLTLLIFKF